MEHGAFWFFGEMPKTKDAEDRYKLLGIKHFVTRLLRGAKNDAETQKKTIKKHTKNKEKHKNSKTLYNQNIFKNKKKNNSN